MNIEEHLLAASIRDTLGQASKAAYKLYNLEQGNTPYNVDEGPHADELAEGQGVLTFYIDKAFRDTAILAERLGLPLYRQDVAAARSALKDLYRLQKPPEEEYRCPALDSAQRLFDSLATMTEGRALTGLGVFENVLGNTAKIISQAGLEPDREVAVSGKIREVLELCFTHVIQDSPIPQGITRYKPDIGVPDLLAAAEYKFADSKEEMKRALREVYTDMRGYGGHPQWRSFYAVFYMTKPFFTQKDVDKEFLLVKADLSWTPIVLVGPGGRKRG
ncbi:hypothetical protein MMB232_00731 [Brevundimonas subvibrioides]|uniref:hypothetical protein n=1 Tax=Brevundimonas subvibrioides TaxID=74313 RepID=UPI0032D595E1